MKKIIATVLCIATVICLFSCGKKEKKIDFTTENAYDFVAHTLTFGEITVRENTNTVRSGKYYVTCTATLSVYPLADYAFFGVYIWLGFDFDGGWYAVRPGNNGAGTSILYDWDDVITLDRDGYATRTLELFATPTRMTGCTRRAQSTNTRLAPRAAA